MTKFIFTCDRWPAILELRRKIFTSNLITDAECFIILKNFYDMKFVENITELM